jgi:hypothetical protein
MAIVLGVTLFCIQVLLLLAIGGPERAVAAALGRILPGSGHHATREAIGIAVVDMPIPVAACLAAYMRLSGLPGREDSRCRRCGGVLRGLREPRCASCGESI